MKINAWELLVSGLLWMAFALTFCGDPDLHDVLVDELTQTCTEEDL